MKSQPKEWKKTFPGYSFDRRLISIINKEHKKLGPKKQITQSTNVQMNQIDTSIKEEVQVANNYNTKKCKSKLHWDFTSPKSEYLSPRMQKEKGKTSEGWWGWGGLAINVNQYNHYGNQHEIIQEN